MAVRKQDIDDEGEYAKNPKKRSRITFDVSPELRRRIKMAAAQIDLSVGEYLARILEQTVPNEPPATIQKGHPITKEAIERLKQFREELIRETNGHVFEDSAELIRREREKRTRYLMGETDVYDED